MRGPLPLSRGFCRVALFSLFGIGLGFFATPAVDTAMTNAPMEKAGIAGGIFKMASSLGAGMGIAIGLAVASGLWPAGPAALSLR